MLEINIILEMLKNLFTKKNSAVKILERQISISFNERVDVLFFVPPAARFLGIGQGTSNLPLGVGYLVSVLKKNGYSSWVYNAEYPEAVDFTVKNFTDVAAAWPVYYEKVKDFNHPIWNEVRWVLRKTMPRIIGITCRDVDNPSALVFAKIVKEIIPDAIVVLGGASANCFTKVFTDDPNIDILVLREGERTMLELTNTLLRGEGWTGLKAVNGIIFRPGRVGEFCTTEDRELIQDLDEIPFPDRESMIIFKNKKIYKVISASDMISTRGCPYLCKFCSCYTIWGTRKPRWRSLDNVIKELKYLHDTYGQDSFYFHDDLFTVNRKKVLEFCSRLIEEKLVIKWGGYARCDTIDPELLREMKKAGCYKLDIGVESGNERVLAMIKKGQTVAQIKHAASILHDSGISWEALLIIGFPGETKDEMIDTMKLIHEIKPTYASVTVFSPYPGTPFFNELKENGTLKETTDHIPRYRLFNNFGTMSDNDFHEFATKVFKYLDDYRDGMRKVPFQE